MIYSIVVSGVYMSMYPKRDHGHVVEMLNSKRLGMQAEAHVYLALESGFQADKDVVCFWSLAIPNSQRELDFLVVHKKLGFAVIEVKSPPLVSTVDGWKLFDKSTGKLQDNQGQGPDKQLGAVSSGIKYWWKGVSGGQRKNPRNIKVLVLVGIESRDFTDNSCGLACRDAFTRQKAGVYIVCRNEIDDLPKRLLNLLELQNPENVRQEAAAFFEEARKSLPGSSGVSPSSYQSGNDKLKYLIKNNVNSNGKKTNAKKNKKQNINKNRKSTVKNDSKKSKTNGIALATSLVVFSASVLFVLLGRRK